MKHDGDESKALRQRFLRVGLTGPMASGKSEVLRCFSRLGIPVFNADEIVHRLYAPGGAAVEGIARLCPGARDMQGGIDRKVLATHVSRDPALLSALEAIVHPHVAEARKAFFDEAEARGAPYAVAEIPLLFETGSERDMDVVIAVVADEAASRQHALARPGMTEETWQVLSSRHMTPDEKAARADIVIRNIGTLANLNEAVKQVHARLMAMAREGGAKET